MKNLLVLGVFLVINGACTSELANSSNNSNQIESEVRKCTSYKEFKLAPKGSVCETSKGGLFKRVTNGTQDLESGLIIMDEIITQDELGFEDVDGHEAKDFCDQRKQRLPSPIEFYALEKRGFRDVLGNMDILRNMKDILFWASESSVYPFNDGNAYYFNANDGKVYQHFHDVDRGNYFGLCVAAAIEN